MPGTNWKIDLAWLAKQAGIRNPFATQIMQWFGQNDYKLRFSTGPTSETHLFSLCM